MLKWNLLDTIHLLEKNHCFHIFSKENFQLFNDGFSRFESLTCYRYIFETYLKRQEKFADVSLCFVRSEKKRFIKDYLEMDRALSLKDNEIWIMLYHFFRLWNKAKSIEDEHILNIWLEFDFNRLMKTKLPEPCLFFYPLKNFNHGQEKKIRQIEQQYSRLITPILENFSDSYTRPPIKDTIKKCIRYSSADAAFFQIGVMLGRADSPLRICLERFSPQDVTALLEHMEWEGDFDQIDSILEMGVEYINPHFALDMDVGTRLHKKIGFEFSFKEKFLNPNKIGSFLNHLCERSLCTEEKKETLLNWTGYSWEKDGRVLIVRSINHFKFVYSEDDPIEVKAYLGLTANPVRDKYWAQSANCGGLQAEARC